MSEPDFDKMATWLWDEFEEIGISISHEGEANNIACIKAELRRAYDLGREHEREAMVYSRRLL